MRNVMILCCYGIVQVMCNMLFADSELTKHSMPRHFSSFFENKIQFKIYILCFILEVQAPLKNELETFNLLNMDCA